ARGVVVGVRKGSWGETAGENHGVCGRWWRAQGFVFCSDCCSEEFVGTHQYQDCRLRSDRSERSVRGPGARRRQSTRVGLVARERARRRGGARPSDRRLGRARVDHTVVCTEAVRKTHWTGDLVSWRRKRSGPQRGDAMTNVALDIPRSAFGVRAFAVALGALVVAAAAQVSIPLPGTPVPMTLQPMAVLLVGGLLGARLGALSMILYLAMGAAGLPVFTPTVPLVGFARLFGPTGGYLLAYPIAAYAVGAIVPPLRGVETGSGGEDWARVALAVLAGLVLIHLGGLAQMAIITGSISGAARLATWPFLLGDLLKL